MDQKNDSNHMDTDLVTYGTACLPSQLVNKRINSRPRIPDAVDGS